MKRTVLRGTEGRPRKDKGRKAVSIPRSRQFLTGATSPPVIQRSVRGCTIRHREFIRDVMFPPLAGEFAPQKLSINPGMASTFPWLAGVANQYEMYSVRSMSFDFQTRSGSGLDGMVSMAVDYDAADPPPDSKAHMLAYDGCVGGPVWHNFTIAIDPRKAHLGMPQRYTRMGIQTDIDLKTYDIGNLYLVAQAPASGTGTNDKFIGELWVSYDICLEIPQLRASAGTGTIEAAAPKPLGQTILPAATRVLESPPARVSSDGVANFFTFPTAWEGIMSYAASKGAAGGTTSIPSLIRSDACPPAAKVTIRPLEGYSVAAPVFKSVQEWAVRVTSGSVLAGLYPSGSAVDLVSAGMKFLPMAYEAASMVYT